MKDIINKEKIEDDKEYEENLNELKKELEKCGKIVQLIIPRIKDGHDPFCVGNVFVEYENEKYA